MSVYLGLDTSNYTTSVCLYDDEKNTVISKRRLLDVKDGELGLRQSEAVFHHTARLPALFEEAFDGFSGEIAGIGVSSAPRAAEGSYMPCFLVGETVASCLSTAMKTPIYRFSHQQGHIAAALYSSDRLDLLFQPHIAFHVSGGTTEAVLVGADEGFLSTKTIARSLDLNAGQLIDRVGVMLGLRFPCGKELEKMALFWEEKVKARPTLKGFDCCLSGGENQCKKMKEDGLPKEYIARYVIELVSATIEGMLKHIKTGFGELPVVFAGGVMSNAIIRENLSRNFDCVFSKPEFSSDNAAGVAVLASKKRRAPKP